MRVCLLAGAPRLCVGSCGCFTPRLCVGYFSGRCSACSAGSAYRTLVFRSYLIGRRSFFLALRFLGSSCSCGWRYVGLPSVLAFFLFWFMEFLCVRARLLVSLRYLAFFVAVGGRCRWSILVAGEWFSASFRTSLGFYLALGLRAVVILSASCILAPVGRGGGLAAFLGLLLVLVFLGALLFRRCVRVLVVWLRRARGLFFYPVVCSVFGAPGLLYVFSSG